MSDGGKTDFYDLKGCKDVDDLAEMLDLRGDEFNCLKAIFGIAIARKTGNTRHNGTSIQRDANKLAHYSARIKERVHKESAEDYKKDVLDAFAKTPVASDSLKPTRCLVEIGSNEHYHYVIEKLYEEGTVKVPYGEDYDAFLKGFVNYIHEHHCDKIKIDMIQFGSLAVIELV